MAYNPSNNSTTSFTQSYNSSGRGSSGSLGRESYPAITSTNRAFKVAVAEPSALLATDSYQMEDTNNQSISSGRTDNISPHANLVGVGSNQPSMMTLSSQIGSSSNASQQSATSPIFSTNRPTGPTTGHHANLLAAWSSSTSTSSINYPGHRSTTSPHTHSAMAAASTPPITATNNMEGVHGSTVHTGSFSMLNIPGPRGQYLTDHNTPCTSPAVTSPPYTLRTSPPSPAVPITFTQPSRHHRRASSATLSNTPIVADDDNDNDDKDDDDTESTTIDVGITGHQQHHDEQCTSPLGDDSTTAASSYNSTAASPRLVGLRPAQAVSPLPTSFVPSQPVAMVSSIGGHRREGSGISSATSKLVSRALRSGSNSGNELLPSASTPTSPLLTSSISPPLSSSPNTNSTMVGSPLLHRRRLRRSMGSGSGLVGLGIIPVVNTQQPAGTIPTQTSMLSTLLAPALSALAENGNNPNQTPNSPMSTTSDASSPIPVLGSTSIIITPAHAPTPTPSPAPPRSPTSAKATSQIFATDSLSMLSPYPASLTFRRYSANSGAPPNTPISPRTPMTPLMLEASVITPSSSLLSCQISRSRVTGTGGDTPSAAAIAAAGTVAPTPLPSPRTPAPGLGLDANVMMSIGLNTPTTNQSTSVEPVTPLLPKTPPCTPNDLASPLPPDMQRASTPRGMSTVSMFGAPNTTASSSTPSALLPSSQQRNIPSSNHNNNNNGVWDRVRDQLNRMSMHSNLAAPTTPTPLLSPTVVSRSEWLSNGRAVTPAAASTNIYHLISPVAGSSALPPANTVTNITTGNSLTVPTNLAGSKGNSPSSTPTNASGPSTATSGTSSQVPTATPTPTTGRNSAGSSPRHFLWNVTPNPPPH